MMTCGAGFMSRGDCRTAFAREMESLWADFGKKCELLMRMILLGNLNFKVMR